MFKAKYPAWFRRFEYFQSVQADGESVEDWWSKKTQLEDYCNLNEIKAEDLRVLELIRGVKPGMRMKFLEDGTKPSENEDEPGAPTVDRLLRLARAKETSHMVQKSLSNPKASKISDYKQNQKDKWSQGQSQPQNRGRDQNQGCSYFGAKEKHGGNPNKGKGSPQSASTIRMQSRT